MGVEARDSRWVIPPAMMPRVGMEEVIGRDGRRYLLRHDAMFTGIQHAQGEFSEFFLSLRDDLRIFGHRCQSCERLIIPPFMRRCPPCNFLEMRKEYVRDVGIVAATPVITIFAPSRFKNQVPFGTGRVLLETENGGITDTAMLVRVRTRQGAIRPGIYHRDTPVKIVFCNQRRGEMLDLFALPQSELTSWQIAKSPLLESDMQWNPAREIAFRKFALRELKKIRAEIVRRFILLNKLIFRSPRAKENLAGWSRNVRVVTSGGPLTFCFNEGRIRVAATQEAREIEPDLVLSVPDPELLVRWLRDATEGGEAELMSPALTDLVVEGTIWLDRPELETITRLDRVPRSLRRDGIL